MALPLRYFFCGFPNSFAAYRGLQNKNSTFQGTFPLSGGWGTEQVLKKYLIKNRLVSPKRLNELSGGGGSELREGVQKYIFLRFRTFCIFFSFKKKTPIYFRTWPRPPPRLRTCPQLLGFLRLPLGDMSPYKSIFY